MNARIDRGRNGSVADDGSPGSVAAASAAARSSGFLARKASMSCSPGTRNQLLFSAPWAIRPDGVRRSFTWESPGSDWQDRADRVPDARQQRAVRIGLAQRPQVSDMG